VQISTTIKRPIEDVFAVMSDSSNRPKWMSGADGFTKTSDGPIGVGTTWHGAGKMFGRRVETDIEYTEFEAGRSFTTKSATPFPNTMAFTLESVDDGTRVTQTVDGEPGGFFKLAGPLLAAAFKRLFQGNLDNLKDLMEGEEL